MSWSNLRGNGRFLSRNKTGFCNLSVPGLGGGNAATAAGYIDQISRPQVVANLTQNETEISQ